MPVKPVGQWRQAESVSRGKITVAAIFWVEDKEIDRHAKRARGQINKTGVATDFMVYVLARYYRRELTKAHARRDRDAILNLIPKQAAFSIMDRRRKRIPNGNQNR